DGLGYDMNTVEFAVRDGVPIAIDFMNCAPDADRKSVGDANFEWVVSNMAEVLIEIARSGRPLELTGSWPSIMETSKAIDEPVKANASYTPPNAGGAVPSPS
ncbi:MAG TPA: hypothetical protein VN605_11925, partial [Thermoanaerobaculia bacterium]|nr:hypothetical protein [Thermoanaerobaculia bacterium]